MIDGGKKGRECFDLEIALVVPPAAPGSGALHTTTVGSNTVKGAPFPPQNPNFGDQDNGSRYTVPTGPLVVDTPTMTGTTAQKAPIGDPGAIDFTVNNIGTSPRAASRSQAAPAAAA